MGSYNVQQASQNLWEVIQRLSYRYASGACYNRPTCINESSYDLYYSNYIPSDPDIKKQLEHCTEPCDQNLQVLKAKQAVYQTAILCLIDKAPKSKGNINQTTMNQLEIQVETLMDRVNHQFIEPLLTSSNQCSAEFMIEGFAMAAALLQTDPTCQEMTLDRSL